VTPKAPGELGSDVGAKISDNPQNGGTESPRPIKAIKSPEGLAADVDVNSNLFSLPLNSISRPDPES
jgi:hypothetical protein